MNSIASRIRITERSLIQDERGWFLKVIYGNEDELPPYTGEFYCTCAFPGQSKGSHYHILGKEWFSPILGKAILKLEDIYSHEKLEIELDSDNPVTVFIPPLIAHKIYNHTKNDFILCAYTDKLYQPNDTISYLFE